MKGNGEAELYTVEQERSHNVTSSTLVGWAVIIVDIGWFGNHLTITRLFIPLGAFSTQGMYAQHGSSASGSPVNAYARAREPPQRSLNSHTPHLPFNWELSRKERNSGER